DCGMHIVTLSYDLKNTLEDLNSDNPDAIEFPDLCVWSAEVLIALTRAGEFICKGIANLDELLQEAQRISNQGDKDFSLIKVESPEFSAYSTAFRALQQHIFRGDIYEVNLCRQETACAENLRPEIVFDTLNHKSPAPFACLHKVQDKYIICSSPERFLRKDGLSLVSQPIKGTSRRFNEPEQDRLSAEALRNSAKEQSENVMIVDLVRNDLSHFAAKGSVKVKELFGIYPFPSVFQMISTVEATLRDSADGIPALAAAFPMGSMTGAPKISAMQLIEKQETFKRGIYSGATGYITDSGDYDFNVVIRSIVWNRSTSVLSLAAGSAITVDAAENHEFDECRLKAEALWKAVKQ
ncbi:MAG: anthranilate synthase component I family protein, partial [Bacteroidetes bacterium]|nr:anthranilate synthase component I family protein [Bacteroidota bacterium]